MPAWPDPESIEAIASASSPGVGTPLRPPDMSPPPIPAPPIPIPSPAPPRPPAAFPKIHPKGRHRSPSIPCLRPLRRIHQRHRSSRGVSGSTKAVAVSPSENQTDFADSAVGTDRSVLAANCTVAAGEGVALAGPPGKPPPWVGCNPVAPVGRRGATRVRRDGTQPRAGPALRAVFSVPRGAPAPRPGPPTWRVLESPGPVLWPWANPG